MNDIETKRLILRTISRADVPEIYQNWANDPEVANYWILLGKKILE